MSDGRTNFNRECGHPWVSLSQRACLICLRKERDRLRAALRQAKEDIDLVQFERWQTAAAKDRIDQALRIGIYQAPSEPHNEGDENGQMDAPKHAGA